MAFCEHCGKEVVEHAKFCRACGGKQSLDNIEIPVIQEEKKPEIKNTPDNQSEIKQKNTPSHTLSPLEEIFFGSKKDPKEQDNINIPQPPKETPQQQQSQQTPRDSHNTQSPYQESKNQQQFPPPQKEAQPSYHTSQSPYQESQNQQNQQAYTPPPNQQQYSQPTAPSGSNPFLINGYSITISVVASINLALYLISLYLLSDIFHYKLFYTALITFTDLIAVGSFVLFLIWLWRTHKEISSISDTPMNFSTGWTIGWFFVPFANYFKPYQAVKDMWQKCTPRSLTNSIADSSSILLAWWIIFIITLSVSWGLTRAEILYGLTSHYIHIVNAIIHLVLQITLVFIINTRLDARKRGL